MTEPTAAVRRLAGGGRGKGLLFQTAANDGINLCVLCASVVYLFFTAETQRTQSLRENARAHGTDTL